MRSLTFRGGVVCGRGQAFDYLLFVSAEFIPGSHDRLLAARTSPVRVHPNLLPCNPCCWLASQTNSLRYNKNLSVYVEFLIV